MKHLSCAICLSCKSTQSQKLTLCWHLHPLS